MGQAPTARTPSSPMLRGRGPWWRALLTWAVPVLMILAVIPVLLSPVDQGGTEAPMVALFSTRLSPDQTLLAAAAVEAPVLRIGPLPGMAVVMGTRAAAERLRAAGAWAVLQGPLAAGCAAVLDKF
ncbi:MAG: hypothetical protein SF002_18530 [Alphaproteobacteria bacterium]|nr:hypothetical protein [Alphaproteobacteria bacterium]